MPNNRRTTWDCTLLWRLRKEGYGLRTSQKNSGKFEKKLWINIKWKK